MNDYRQPQPLSKLISPLTRQAFGQKNALFGRMVAEWRQLAGEEWFQRTIPLKLQFSRPRGKKKETTTSAPAQATLHLSIHPAFAMEFSYHKALMIERLNIFFGYRAITDIKTIQNSAAMARASVKAPLKRPLTIQESTNIERQVAKIQQNDLQRALKNLGTAITARRKTPHGVTT